YGEEAQDYRVIHDWKSGTTAGAKTIGLGIFDGVVGIFVLPYKGAKGDGSVGVFKGIEKGLAGISSKA
ncbi:hypothetical protein CC78DRAFT_426406, partial [Lojkania enalia]